MVLTRFGAHQESAQEAADAAFIAPVLPRGDDNNNITADDQLAVIFRITSSDEYKKIKKPLISTMN